MDSDKTILTEIPEKESEAKKSQNADFTKSDKVNFREQIKIMRKSLQLIQSLISNKLKPTLEDYNKIQKNVESIENLFFEIFENSEIKPPAKSNLKQSKFLDKNSSPKFLRILNSDNARKILFSIKHESMSAEQICFTCNIPLTKVYRCLKKFQDLDLVEVSGIINNEGRKVKLYKSLVSMIKIDPNYESNSRIELVGLWENN